jgi:hypothetical protein
VFTGGLASRGADTPWSAGNGRDCSGGDDA